MHLLTFLRIFDPTAGGARGMLVSIMRGFTTYVGSVNDLLDGAQGFIYRYTKFHVMRNERFI
jgi:hypothetical protein